MPGMPVMSALPPCGSKGYPYLISLESIIPTLPRHVEIPICPHPILDSHNCGLTSDTSVERNTMQIMLARHARASC